MDQHVLAGGKQARPVRSIGIEMVEELHLLAFAEKHLRCGENLVSGGNLVEMPDMRLDGEEAAARRQIVGIDADYLAVSYTHLTLPTMIGV